MNCNEVDRIEKAIRDVTEVIDKSFKTLEDTLQLIINPTPTSNCGYYCDKSTPDIKADSVKIVSWAEGNYDEIGAMLDAHYAGKINIADYWHIGDVRVEYMNEIPESNGFEYHAGHDIELVLVEFNTPISFSSKTAVVVMVKDGLSTMGPMNIEPFSEYSRMRWLNNEFVDSLPIELNSRMNKISHVGGRVCLPSFDEMRQILYIDPELFRFTFINAWTRDTSQIYHGSMSCISSILDRNLELRKSYSLPFDQRNIVPIFCL